LQISLQNVSKRYERQWLFKDVHVEINQGDRLAILGPNGSGKSTFLKLICGYVRPSSGDIYWRNLEILPIEQWHAHFSYCAPYLDLIEEFSLNEMVSFHFELKMIRPHVDLDNLLSLAQLSLHKKKQISGFSSGMKQRLKLILSLSSEAQIYFLDEPTTNLDEQGKQLYLQLVNELPEDKTVIVASNDRNEYDYCTNRINIPELLG
jgi:ABC-type multidrug transport system ATPase subunit